MSTMIGGVPPLSNKKRARTSLWGKIYFYNAERSSIRNFFFLIIKLNSLAWFCYAKSALF